MKACSIDAPTYNTTTTAPAPARMSDDEILAAARAIVARRYFSPDAPALLRPDLARDYARLHCVGKKEAFWMVSLDAAHVPLNCKKLFSGTLSSCSVYPREVIAEALKSRAASVIFIHNHPSGQAFPSDADKTLTKHLRQALQLLDIHVLDHLIVGRDAVHSMAEHGEV